MKLQIESKIGNWLECKCEITEKLDELSGFTNNEIFGHYILITKKGKNEKYLSIKVPGGTVGCIEFDCNKYITNIVIDTCCIVTYYGDVNSEIKKYIGEKLDF